MVSPGEFGKMLVLFGGILLATGVLLISFGKIPWIGKLPGDIYVQKKNFVFYFPLATCILISIILTLTFMLLRKK
jgi:hypothetical protein